MEIILSGGRIAIGDWCFAEEIPVVYYGFLGMVVLVSSIAICDAHGEAAVTFCRVHSDFQL